MFNKFITIVLMNALWLSTAFSSTTTIKAIDQIVPFTGSLGIGGIANANAILDAQSTTKAFIPPRMTTTQKNAIVSPTAGMMVYDSTLNSIYVYTGAAWSALSALPSSPSAYFAGDVITTARSTCPTGTIAADGTSYLRTTYPDLFTAIGTTHGTADVTHFNVPDYRGRFLRGVDGTAGIDPDKAARTAMNVGGNTGNNVGSIQGDINQSHTHIQDAHGHATKGLANNILFAGAQAGEQALRNAGGGYADYSYIGATTATNQYSGGSESRPRNAYVNYCVRTTNSTF